MGKIILWGFIVILAAGLVSASVVINQVLYNPSGTESGGEAVELYNNGNEGVDISGWKLATEASAHDAVIPDTDVMCPGCYYLIADTGWNESKDNSSWADADFEELINLYNTDSGVALINGEETVDAVGWGNKDNIGEGLFEDNPANHTEEGKSLLRINDTGNNKNDFIESSPFFRSSSDIGGYSAETEIVFEIESEPQIVEISIFPSKIDFGRITAEKDYSSEIIVRNTGNVAVDLGVRCEMNPASIRHSFNYNYNECNSNAVINDIGLEPGSNATLKIKLNAPNNSTKGKYAGKLIITAVKSEN